MSNSDEKETAPFAGYDMNIESSGESSEKNFCLIWSTNELKLEFLIKLTVQPPQPAPVSLLPNAPFSRQRVVSLSIS